MIPYVRRAFIKYIDRRNGNDRFSYLPEIARYLELDREEMARRQWARLRATIEHAHESIPFYKKRFRDAGVSPADITGPEDLLRIPLLTRADLRNHLEDLVDPRCSRSELVETRTGATTEAPVRFLLDRHCYSARTAESLYFYRWFGHEPGDKIAYLWGAEQDFSVTLTWKDRFKQILGQPSLGLQSTYLNEQIMHEHYSKLSSFRPKMLQGFSTALYLFSLFLEANNLRLPPMAVNVSAEHLYPHQRDKIEAVFGTKVFNWYGARDLGHVATECRLHHGLHLNTHGLYTEAIDERGGHVYDRPAQLVFTDLNNKAMPLIRYQIGDIGSLSQRRCPCGSELPMLEELGGRYASAFKKKDGTYVPNTVFPFHVLSDPNKIEQLQIIQKEYDLFHLNIVRGKDFCEADLDELEEHLCGFMHDRLRFETSFVNNIAPEKSGKVLFSKSEVKE